MNPAVECGGRALAYKDAVYFSVHKFVGGPQTPGVLVAKKKLFRNKVGDTLLRLSFRLTLPCARGTWR
jgi:hypothetical protein